MADIQMISPPHYVHTSEEKGERAVTVYGWIVSAGVIEPVVGNPDGPGVGRWALYYGEDPWSVS